MNLLNFYNINRRVSTNRRLFWGTYLGDTMDELGGDDWKRIIRRLKK